MNRCANNGCLVDAKLPLPSDPTELYVAPLPPVGCNRLRCIDCGVKVRNAPGLAFATRDDVAPGELSKLYDVAALASSPLLSGTHPRFRLYLCRCSRWLENDHHFITTPDRDLFTDPNVPWRCEGHPIVELPHDIHGVPVVSRDALRELVARALRGFDPPGAPAEEKDAQWLTRLYYRLAVDDAGLVAQVARDTLADPEPQARQRALHFFDDVPDATAREVLAELLEKKRELFAGVPEASPLHLTDTTLEHTAWRVLDDSIATSSRARELARADALAGRASRAVYDALVIADAEWMIAHVEDVARAAPERVEDLEKSFKVTSHPAIFKQLTGRARRAVGTSATPVAKRSSIDRASVMAHREWYHTGNGARMDVSGVSAAGARLDGTELVRARFEHVDFSRANIDQSDWSQCELIACTFIDARLNRLKLVGGTILDCNLDGAAGAMLDLSKIKLSGSSFVRAGLSGCHWIDAIVSATKLTGASFGNARWDRARFVDCSFRDASLEPDRDSPPMRMRGVVFEDCDFRNATFTGVDFRGAMFERCKLAGTRGEPKYKTELTVVDCDLSKDELVAQLVLPTFTADEVRARASYVVVRDQEPGAIPERVVFDIGGRGAKRVAQTSAPATASTCGRNGIVWAATEDTFTIWSADGRPFTSTRAEIRTPGGVTPVSAVTRVVSFIHPDDLGRRGVAIETPSGRVPRLVVVQEQDLIAYEDTSFTLDDARREGRWAALLGNALAEWLGVAHDDGFG